MAEEGSEKWMPSHHYMFDKECVLEMPMVPHMPQIQNWSCRDDDVFVCSWPKCGTTWVQAIVWQIMHNVDSKWSGIKHMDADFPMMEFIEPNVNISDLDSLLDWPVPDLSTRPSPRLMKTHIPFRLLCDDIQKQKTKAKIIYVTRNPKDAVVSFYYFDTGFNIEGFTDPRYPKLKFPQYLERFFNDLCLYGSYWAHNIEFWERREWESILFLKYEDMLKDPWHHVSKIAKFLGKDLTDEQISMVTETTSFKNMKNNNVVNYEYWSQMREEGSAPFMRKGKVGDWKNHFTVAQSQLMDEIYKEKFSGTGLTHDFVLKPEDYK